MFRSISNIRIFPRLLILFTVLVTISSIAMVSLSAFYLQASHTHAQAVKTSFNAQQVATTQQINLQRMNALLQARFAQIVAQGNPALLGDPSLAASGGLIQTDITAREIDFSQAIANYDLTFNITESANMSTIRSILQNDPVNLHLISDQQGALDAVVDQGGTYSWQKYQSLQNQVLTALNNKNFQFTPTYALLYKANQQFLILQKNWQIVVDTTTTAGQAVTDLANSEILPVEIATGAAIGLIILLIALTAYLVNITISRPLTQLASLTGRIAQGDTSERAPVEGRDEISVVATSMNTMLDNIVQLIQEARSRHIVLQAQVEKLIKEVSGAGEGDLRVQAEVSSDSLGVLAKSFNFVISELGSLVVNFKTLANEVERATIQAYDDMSQLVDNADQQIQHITTTTVNIEEMANTSRQVAERVQVLSRVGNEAYVTTQNGRNAVMRSVEGMERINTNVHATSSRVQELSRHSQEIDNIVKVIAGIAHQTNRLALDAAIQAAMAGENGKGFRTIAEDIRRSAEIAKEQTAKIEQIVKRVLADIQSAAFSIRETESDAANGMQSSQEAGSAFEAIFTAIEHQAHEIETINRAARQQLQVSNSVLQMMQGVSASTHKSSLSIREEARRMEGVAELAEQLLASAEVFKLREDQDIFAQVGNNQAHAPQQGTVQQGFPQVYYPNGKSPSMPLTQERYPSQTNGSNDRFFIPQTPAVPQNPNQSGGGFRQEPNRPKQRPEQDGRGPYTRPLR